MMLYLILIFSFFTGSHSLEAGESGFDDESQDIAGGTKAIIIYPNIFLLFYGFNVVLEFFEYNENDSDSSTSESASHTHQELEVSIYY